MVHIQYWRWESFPCLTVSHKFPQETSCPNSSVVITHVWKFLWLYLGDNHVHGNHRNVQKWTVLPRTQCVRWNLWDTVRHGKLSHRQYCISYGPHTFCTPLSVYWGWYFSAPDTHVLCMGSRTATGIFAALRLVHSLLNFFSSNFSCDIEFNFTLPNIQIWILIFRLLVWSFGSTYRKGEILKQKWHVNSQFVYCYC